MSTSNIVMFCYLVYILLFVMVRLPFPCLNLVIDGEGFTEPV